MIALPPSENDWKILVIDDEEDVHVMTRLALSDLRFEQRGVQFLEARSSIEAVRLFAEHPDIAVALINSAMETESGGLQLVRYVRHCIHNSFMRLILLIKPPQVAPERSVLIQYEIDDCKTRIALEPDALFTSVFAALRNFRNMRELDQSRRATRCQLEVANAMLRATDLRALASIATAKALVILELEQAAYWNDFAGAWWVEMPTMVSDGHVLAAVGRHADLRHEQLLMLAEDCQDSHRLALDIPTKWGRQFRLCVALNRASRPHDRDLLELLRMQAILIANSLLANETHPINEQEEMSQTVHREGFGRSSALRPVREGMHA